MKIERKTVTTIIFHLVQNRNENSHHDHILFGSKSKGKQSPRSYSIQFERKWKPSCFNAERNICLNKKNQNGKSVSMLVTKMPKKYTLKTKRIDIIPIN